MDIDDMSYIGEPIKLDKVRHIKFTIKGLKLIAKKSGSVVKAFNDMQLMNKEFDVEGMDHLVLLLHAGLIHEDPTLTIENVENFLTMGNMTTIFTAIIRAFNGSMPEPAEGGSTDDLGEQK